MQITLNGQPFALENTLCLADLLTSLALTGLPIAVEINQLAILPRTFPTTMIHPGDQVEIITLAAGG